jgi:hypothetical protein
MAPTEKAQQELEEIERQVAELEVSGADDATRRQLAKLQDRLETVRLEMNGFQRDSRRPQLRRRRRYHLRHGPIPRR